MCYRLLVGFLYFHINCGPVTKQNLKAIVAKVLLELIAFAMIVNYTIE